MDLRELGEFGLIEAIRRRAGRKHPEWRIAIGDDAAVLTPKRGEEIVLTADALVEDVHFRWKTTDARSLGHKALAVNLSDVGAMGARPLGFDAWPAIDGARSTLRRLLAARESCQPSRRSRPRPARGGHRAGAGAAARSGGARAGDRLFVTGELGGAAAGLRLLEGPVALGAAEQRLVRRQLAPAPPWRAGARLVKSRLARAAIDVSDGLAQDLGHLARESRVGARIELERLPLARGLAAAAARLGADPLELALGRRGLRALFAAPAPHRAQPCTQRLGCRVTEIGVTTAARQVVFTRAGRSVEPKAWGFSHFKAPLRDSEK